MSALAATGASSQAPEICRPATRLHHGGVGVESRGAPEEVIGVQPSRDDVRVGERRSARSCRAGSRPAPDLRRRSGGRRGVPGIVQPRHGATAGADLDDLVHRRLDRVPGGSRRALDVVQRLDPEPSVAADVLAVVPPMSRARTCSAPMRRPASAAATTPATGPDSSRFMGAAAARSKRGHAAAETHRVQRVSGPRLDGDQVRERPADVDREPVRRAVHAPPARTLPDGEAPTPSGTGRWRVADGGPVRRPRVPPRGHAPARARPGGTGGGRPRSQRRRAGPASGSSPAG